jgi:ribosomal protein S18 acetylase RimI-like enzyme
MSLSIRHLGLEDLKDVSSIHSLAFTDSALTKLGSEAVRRYYEWQLIGPHDSVNLGVFDENQLVGFCIGGVFRGSLGGFLEKNQSFLIFRVISHPWLIFNPLLRGRLEYAVKRIFRLLFSRPNQDKPSSELSESTEVPAFGILSIAVSPKYQGLGASKLLMEHSEALAKEQGFQRMKLSVHETNLRAIAFYEKLGWEKVMKEGLWDGRMHKWLNNKDNQ